MMSEHNFKLFSPHKVYLSETVTSSVMQLSDTSQYLKHSPEELLSFKKGKTKSSEAQRLCQSLLRDAAMFAKIWNKAPLLSEIELNKQEIFFSYVASHAPHIAGRRNELWVRLGRMLQNRRKYLNDIEIGKRKKPLTQCVASVNNSCFADLSMVKVEMNDDTSDQYASQSENNFGIRNSSVCSMQSSRGLSHTPNSARCWHGPEMSSYGTYDVTMGETVTYENCASNGSRVENVKMDNTEDENSDFAWHPPSEAEMKLIRARRDRSDKISKLMGDYLLKGYKMLSTVCDCGTIILQDRNGENYCIACNELDTDTDKDDPLTSEEAALAQVREQELVLLRDDGASPMSSVSDGARVPVNQQFLKSSGTAVNQKTTNRKPDAPQRQANYSALYNLNQSSMNDSQSIVDHVDTLDTLKKKLSWATSELDKTPSVEYSIQLCHLIKSCSEAIQSLKAL